MSNRLVCQQLSYQFHPRVLLARTFPTTGLDLPCRKTSFDQSIAFLLRAHGLGTPTVQKRQRLDYVQLTPAWKMARAPCHLTFILDRPGLRTTQPCTPRRLHLSTSSLSNPHRCPKFRCDPTFSCLRCLHSLSFYQPS